MAISGERVLRLAERVVGYFGEEAPELWEDFEAETADSVDDLWRRIEGTPERLGASLHSLVATIKEREITKSPEEWDVYEPRRSVTENYFEHEAARQTLPSQDLIDRVTKYEAHLERQLTSGLRCYYAAQGARLSSAR